MSLAASSEGDKSPAIRTGDKAIIGSLLLFLVLLAARDFWHKTNTDSEKLGQCETAIKSLESGQRSLLDEVKWIKDFLISSGKQRESSKQQTARPVASPAGG